MLFAFPYAWLGGVTLAGLVAVYVFRSRHRRRPVSSLMLWQDAAKPRQGGLRRDTLSLPPLFYLELAALAACVVAAAAPHVLRPSAGTLVVVFDASASMTARGPDGETPQARAARALRRETARLGCRRVRLLIAGVDGPALAEAAHPSQAAARLERVDCVAGEDALALALARAGEVAEPADDVLVLTDRPPPDAAAGAGRARWLAVGRPLGNAALTYADRSCRPDGSEALLAEVTAFGLPRARVRLGVSDVGGAHETPLVARELELEEAKPARVVLELPPGAGPVRLALPDDALAADNRALLLPDRPRPVSVEVRVNDERLRACVRRAAEASGRAVFGVAPPQLAFVDGADVQTGAPFWQVALCRPEDPRLVRGPFLLDQAQPLLEGVSFDGLVWAVGTNAPAGRGLAFAGDAPLLTLESAPRQTPVVRLLAGSAQDTLFQAAAWPALVWNVLAACAEAQPGPSARNVRLGSQVQLALPPGEGRAAVETPNGEVSLRARGGRAMWRPPAPGLYRLRLADAEQGRFAVNLFAAGESDLRRCARGEWGGAARSERLARTHRSYAWLAGAAALALAALHHLLVSRQAAGGSRT